MKSGYSLLIGVLAVLGATGASAHHSFAMFDNTKEVVIDGTIREFQWTNPHTWIQVVVMEDGKPVEYSVEGTSPNILSRRGWSKTSFNPGDRVKITMNPMKDGSKGGSFKRAEFADGRKLSESNS